LAGSCVGCEIFFVIHDNPSITSSLNLTGFRPAPE
jgi:hypothetical protein